MMRIKAVVLLFIVLLLVGCWEGEIGMRSPESFPQRDIVFQRAVLPGGEYGLSLGFVNADGSGLIVLQFHALFAGWSTMADPAWSSDGSTLVFRALGHNRAGPLMISRAGEEVRHCPDETVGWGRASFLGQGQIVVEGWAGAGDVIRPKVIDLETCKVIRVYLDEAEEEVIGTPTITSDGQWLAFVLWEEDAFRGDPSDIVVLEVASNTQTVIGKGRWPSWSPDGRWLAYTGEDGIYVVTRDGSQKRCLVSFPKGWEGWNGWPPAPSWSPDGQWLVYHKCMAARGWCEEGSEYSIFKVNVETGEEIKIVDGGLNPYWRWAEP